MTRTEFNDIVRRHNRMLYLCAFRILRNQEEAEDAVQEIFIKLWTMKERLDRYNSIEALATTMVKNHSIDQMRKKRPENYEDIEIAKMSRLRSISPHEELERKESGSIIQRIIESLPDIYKIIIKKRDIEGLSYEEISIETGQNINTLRVNLSRARGIIREEYNKCNDEQRGIKRTSRKVL